MTTIVVDNASTDTTVQRVLGHAGVRLIQNQTNRGFAAAVNQGASEAPEASCVLILNPDARLLTPMESVIEAACQHGLAAGRLIGEDGKTQTGFTVRRFPTPVALALELFGINRLWPSNTVNRRYRYLDRDLSQPGFVEQPAGAFLAVRRDAWQQLGGMDEGFHPVWFEDVDLCKRAKEAGFEISYVPSVMAEHTGGHSVGNIPAASRAVYWYVSLLKYAAKHFRAIHYRGICAAVMLSSIPRAVAGMIDARSVTPLVTYARIFWAAGRFLASRQKTLRPHAGSI